MNIAIGSDHAGLAFKALVFEALSDSGHQVTDLGTLSNESTDYPEWAHNVAHAVVAGEAERGILICGTGQGMAMAANKVPGIRAAVVSDVFSATMTRLHNDANVLCLGERIVGPGLALLIVDSWINTEFEGGRHARRVGKIEPS